LTFNLNLSAGTGTFNCRFYNPRSGQFGATFQRPGGGTESFTKPDSSDWVLHVVAVPQAPVAVIGANPTSGASPLLVSFDGSASYDTDGGTIVTYAWDFENDGTTDATGPTPSHTYLGNRTAVAKLTVTDNDGRNGTATISISITALPGDFDGDGDIDQKDFGHLQACYSGSGEQQTDPDCLDAILDGDGDVDASDFAIFQTCMSGPNVPASCGS
jgi:PKD repeat protein